MPYLPKKNTLARNGFEAVPATPGVQPDLVDLFGELSPAEDRGSKRTPWHHATLAWWGSLTDHPTFHGLTQAQWFDLAQIAVLYDAVSKGALKHRTELRQSLAGYMLTPGDLRKNSMELATRPAIAPVAESADTNPEYLAYLAERVQ